MTSLLPASLLALAVSGGGAAAQAVDPDAMWTYKTVDGKGRRAILEILVNNRAIAKMITSDQTHQVPSQLQTGADQGMQLMDAALLRAIQKKEIDPDDAIRFANDKRKFKRFVTDTDVLPMIDGGGNEMLGGS